jgi:hypothetical protein
MMTYQLHRTYKNIAGSFFAFFCTLSLSISEQDIRACVQFCAIEDQSSPNMAAATVSSAQQWSITGQENGFEDVKLQKVAVPQVGENEVLVKLNAASLNYRDLIIPKVKHTSVSKQLEADIFGA